MLRVVLALSVTWSCALAHAQSEEELERARVLFAEGVRLLDAEQYDEAVTRFRGVLEIRESGPVKYNLALALEGSGEYAEAVELLEEVVADRSVGARIQRDARRTMRELAARVGHLTISLQGDDDRANVTIDNVRVGLEDLGQPIAVDPGDHTIRVTRGGREIATREVTVAQGENERVALILVAPEHEDERVELPPPRVYQEGEMGGLPEERSNDPNGTSPDIVEQWWFWAAMGAIAVVIVTIIVAVATSP
jgi:hypothetical protein